VINQNEFNENKKIIRKDTWFVCSMLVIYAICFILVIGGSYIWIRDDRNATYAHATATEGAIATQQANATATAVAHSTEQAQFEIIDRFDNNSGRWYTGNASGDYGDFSAYIINGLYTWSITNVKGYTQGDDFHKGNNFKNFDTYLDIKFDDKMEAGTTCSGLVFRKSSLGWEDGAYVYSICNDAHYGIFYYQTGDWETINVSLPQSSINPTDWNRIEVQAMGDHFTFYANNTMIYEMTDTRRQSGRVGIFIEVRDDTPALIWFDNFGLQRR